MRPVLESPRVIAFCLAGLGLVAGGSPSHAETPQPEPIPSGAWAFSPARFPELLQEVSIVPLTRQSSRKTWTRPSGERRLPHVLTLHEEAPTGSFRLSSAEGGSTVFDGIYDPAGSGFAKRPRDKDNYPGIEFKRAAGALIVAESNSARLQPYRGTVFLRISDSPLFAALRAGDRAAIKATPDLAAQAKSSRDQLGRTLLYRAAQLGDTETVVLLLGEGVPADLRNDPPRSRTALAAAIKLSRLEIIDLLIAAGADVNLPDAKGARPLHIAGEGCGKYTQIVRRLLAAGADPSLTDNSGETPRMRLERAKASGFLPILDREIAARPPTISLTRPENP